jgi:serine-type D-Ala-D-Ala carboxypeptidase/endopeptidase
MRAMRHLPATLLALSALLLPLVGHAEPTGFDSPPASLAARVLGDRPGTIVAGTWRDGTARYAIQRNRPGHVGKAKAMAPGEAQPVFEIGSISKVFTGVLLAQAVERGELSLDDTLGQLLAGKVTSFASEHVAAVTLRQLVTHTSCMPRLPLDFQAGSNPDNPYRGYDLARLWKALSTMRFEAAPPCAMRYSNLGVGLLGELLAERYGQPWETLVRERIAGPLGMRDTLVTLGDKAPRLAPSLGGSKPAPQWQMAAFVGAGGLRSTAADLLLFGRALLAGRDGPLGAAAERVVTPLARSEGQIGYAIFIRGPADRRTFMHNGAVGGYRSQLMLAADTGEVLVVLASNAEAPVDRLSGELIASRYPVAPGATDAKANCLAECAGVYRTGKSAAYTFVVQNGVMHMHATGQAFNALVPSGTDAFTFGTIIRVVFERDGSGRVSSARQRRAPTSRRRLTPRRPTQTCGAMSAATRCRRAWPSTCR